MKARWRLSTLGALALFLLAGCTNAAPTPTPVPPTPTPTTVAARPTATPSPSPTPAGTPRPRLFVVVRSETPSTRTGNKQTASVETLPGALCAPTVTDASGAKTGGFLAPKQSDAEGKASWTWTVSPGTAQGASKVTVRCILGQDEASGTASYQVFPGPSS